VNCFSMSPDEAIRRQGSIGKPTMFTQARLVDGEGKEVPEVPKDQLRELCLRARHVCKGCWNNPTATAAAFDRDGWLHTGDMARCDDEGFFYIVGRSKDMFISGSVNVYPVEIEAELLRCPAVRDAAVIGVPDPNWGEVGVAFVVSTGATIPSADELRNFLADKIARYKLPRDFIFVDAPPCTA
jgi:fatty-acyl-CoA synthase